MNTIESVSIKVIPDDMPDTSFLGEYTDELRAGVIVRTADGPVFYEDWPEDKEFPRRGREYIGFLPYAGGEKPGSEHYREYALQDYEHMEGLNRGDWQFVGIRASAVILLPGGIRQTIETPGIWGIESDSGHKYFEEIALDELVALKKTLDDLNVDTSGMDVDEIINDVDVDEIVNDVDNWKYF